MAYRRPSSSSVVRRPPRPSNATPTRLTILKGKLFKTEHICKGEMRDNNSERDGNDSVRPVVFRS